jgi:hypothetical protein
MSTTSLCACIAAGTPRQASFPRNNHQRTKLVETWGIFVPLPLREQANLASVTPCLCGGASWALFLPGRGRCGTLSWPERGTEQLPEPRSCGYTPCRLSISTTSNMALKSITTALLKNRPGCFASSTCVLTAIVSTGPGSVTPGHCVA